MVKGAEEIVTLRKVVNMTTEAITTAIHPGVSLPDLLQVALNAIPENERMYRIGNCRFYGLITYC
jgi:hypothetical protein